MATKVVPSLGHSIPFTQAGDGTTPGYDAIDRRRFASAGWQEGPLSLSSYVVSQRAAGANMSVDIAASTGPGALIQGDSVTQQGRYLAPPHSAVINEVIATADATNPRIDSVVLEAKDNTHDAGGLNQVQTRVITGTPIAAVTNEAPGASPAALPSGAMLLAYVQVDAAAASIANAKIKDMRPKRRGKLSVAGSESTTATTYAYSNLATPDRITQIVLPTDGLIVVWYQAIWQNTVASNGRAAIFLSGVQLKIGQGTGVPIVSEVNGPAETNDDAVLATVSAGLGSVGGAGAATEVTTGQIVAQGGSNLGGPLYIFAAAGTYDISVQFKNNAAGTTTIKNRHLWVASLDFDNATLT